MVRRRSTRSLPHAETPGAPGGILINDAGFPGGPEISRDARGYEVQFAVNHLGHFQFTCGLYPPSGRPAEPES
ncbi:hypothetical protein [Phytoactinopolyspora endophytica]|uniref:hypothetical protein n=1 Tax=Phytoactinopolyspora endophytica TaxID=1642495 RepID=UPI0013EDADF1|nr:hypothetical protein [Phytoactinopolyspora endophytica]